MKIDQAYNLWAKQYDTNSNRTRDLDALVTIETLDILSFSTVIELGCGTGKNTKYLLGKADEVIALDFSDEMLNQAKARINHPHVAFHKVDLLSEWNINNNYADLITSSLVLEHIENLHSIFRQAFDKLKSGGHFFISELHPFKQYLGSKAKFETEDGFQELETFTHHISDFLAAGTDAGFDLVELKEWFDLENTSGIPRLLGLVFQKK